MRTTCRSPVSSAQVRAGGGIAGPRWSFVFETDSEAVTRHLGEALGKLAAPGWVVLLSGPLGAGKTVFARGLLHGAGITGPVRSPTFTLLNEYQGRIAAWHADLYRLEGDAGFAAIGGDEVLLGEEGMVVVEWAERLRGEAPARHIEVDMSFGAGGAPDDRRVLRITLTGERYRAAAGVLASWPGASQGGPKQ